MIILKYEILFVILQHGIIFKNKKKGENQVAEIATVIKYEGDNQTFIWKHPAEDFNCLSQLIVHESQEAIFFMNGQALDTFGPGRYTLETENIPKIGKVLNRATGDQTPFHCEVYFINQTVQMSLKWGTDSKVRYIEPESGIPLEIGASGEMNMKISDGRKLLIGLVGTMNGIAWGEGGENFTKSLQNSFRPMISTAVKSNLTVAIKESGVNLLEVDEHLDELSDVLRKKITAGFEEYGITIPQFYITTVVLPEEDENFKRIRALYAVSLTKKEAKAQAEITAAKREAELEAETTKTEVLKREAEREIIEAKTEAEKKKAEGFAEAEVMHAKGYNEKDVIEAEVKKAFAEGIGNMGSGGGGGGSTMSDIVGLGIGLQAAGAMGSQVGGIFAGMTGAQQGTNPPSTVCPSCNAVLPAGAKFCLQCGRKTESASFETVVCPACGKTVEKGKFCPQCGHKFIASVCPKCGKEAPDGAKFCLECGEKL